MNFLQAQEWFAAKADEVVMAKEKMLLAGAAIVEKEAKDSLGTYHGAAGPFDAWAELAQSTQERRAQMGFTANEPLLMTGELRDSIHTVIGDDVVAVGTNIPFAPYLERGTSKIPPRPFIGRAGWVKQEEILAVQAEILETILSL